MDSITYQKRAKEFAIYPKEIALEYLAIAICGEFGEILNKIKKVIRDNNGEFAEEKIEQLSDELGDVCWYAAQICTEIGVVFSIDRTKPSNHRNISIPQIVISCNAILAESMERMYSGNMEQATIKKLQNIIVMVASALNVDLSNVFERNIEKLSSRHARTVLGGSGDYR